MKFLEILMSFLVTQGKSFMQTNTTVLSKQLVNNARRIVILLSAAAISIALLCVGFSTALAGILAQYDQSEWHFTAGIVGGLLVVVASLLGLVYSLGEARWLKATGADQSKPESLAQNTGPTLESAFALLIIELSSELKARRSDVSKNQSEAPQI